ncbi:MAG: MFS transporter [Acetobacteraceae bacterium]|nr:MFS transporter [Acetobacteraceae bacterium]
MLDVIEAQSARAFEARLMLWIALAMFVEGYDMQVAGYAAPAIIHDWGISKASFGAVFSLGMAGYMFGALALSNLGDRFGRRVLTLGGVFFFGAVTVGCALATSPAQMTVLRVAAGIGLGAAIPNVIALAAEYAPQRLRATRVAIAFAFYTVGSAAGGFIAAWMLPRFGWPSLFHAGGWAALLLGVALIFALPESARFLVASGRDGERLLSLLRRLSPDLRLPQGTQIIAREEQRQTRSALELFRGGLLPTTLLLWSAYICNMVALHFMTSWLPTIIEASGVGLASAAITTGLFQGGGTAGTLLAGRLLDRRGILPLALVFVAAVPIVAAVGEVAGSVAVTMLLITLAGVCIPGGQGGINALAGTLYPTAIRATGAGWALGVGRVGSILGPALGALLIALDLPYKALFAFLAIPPLLTALALAGLARTRSVRSGPERGLAAAPGG